MSRTRRKNPPSLVRPKIEKAHYSRRGTLVHAWTIPEVPVVARDGRCVPVGLPLGRKGTRRDLGGWASDHVRPRGRFWRRYFNKKVRKGGVHGRQNWMEWS